MNQDIVKSLNLELAEILKSKDDPSAKLAALAGLIERMDLLLAKTSVEYQHLMSVICEVSGNQYALSKNLVEAEKQYRKMTQYAAELYQKDKQKFDLLLAQANFRMGVFYQDLLKVKHIMPRAVVLNEKQKPVYETCIKHFQTAVQAAISKIKAGNQPAVELQMKAMHNVMLLRAVVGDYQEAEKLGVQLVKVGKALFQAADDVPHALALSEWMVNLATVYTVQKQFVEAMEIHEDCIYVLEDKYDQNPEAFGIRLASEYMNLGNVCQVIPEEKDGVAEYYQKAMAFFEKLNQEYDHKYANEEAQARVLVENYNKKKN